MGFGKYLKLGDDWIETTFLWFTILLTLIAISGMAISML